jgi:Family of unknown function (DUF5684)
MPMNLFQQAFLLADNDSVGPVILIVELVLIVLAIAGIWATYEKAGQPGWGSIIPFYNMILLLRIAGRPAWWLLLFFIPLVNIVIAILIGIEVARNFGKGLGFGLGLVFLGFIFYPILGFGDAAYQPRAATS